MRSVVIDKPGDVVVRDFADPAPGPGEAVVDIKACGFCGTDLHIFRGEYLGRYPVRPGHEAAGVVSAAGEGVTGLRVGERVAIEPNIRCGRCPMCRTGRGNFCENWSAIGVTRPGCMAGKVLAPASQLFPMGTLAFESGAFMEPLSCCLHGMKKIEPLAGADVLILGAGPVGLLMLQLARLRGASRVTVSDLRDARLALARALGADDSVAPAKLADARDGFDVVIDCSGSVKAIARTPALARPGGKLLWFGVAPKDEAFPVEPFEVFRKGLAVFGAFTSLDNSVEALELLQSARVRTEPIVSHRLPLEEFARAARLVESDPAALKVMLIP